jgi:hypothetical protein
MFGVPVRLPAFGARTFPTVITTTSVVQDLHEKISDVDCMMRCIYRSRAIFSDR